MANKKLDQVEKFLDRENMEGLGKFPDYSNEVAYGDYGKEVKRRGRKSEVVSAQGTPYTAWQDKAMMVPRAGEAGVDPLSVTTAIPTPQGPKEYSGYQLQEMADRLKASLATTPKGQKQKALMQKLQGVEAAVDSVYRANLTPEWLEQALRNPGFDDRVDQAFDVFVERSVNPNKYKEGNRISKDGLQRIEKEFGGFQGLRQRMADSMPRTISSDFAGEIPEGYKGALSFVWQGSKGPSLLSLPKILDQVAARSTYKQDKTLKDFFGVNRILNEQEMFDEIQQAMKGGASQRSTTQTTETPNEPKTSKAPAEGLINPLRYKDLDPEEAVMAGYWENRQKQMAANSYNVGTQKIQALHDLNASYDDLHTKFADQADDVAEAAGDFNPGGSRFGPIDSGAKGARSLNVSSGVPTLANQFPLAHIGERGFYENYPTGTRMFGAVIPAAAWGESPTWKFQPLPPGKELPPLSSMVSLTEAQLKKNPQWIEIPLTTPIGAQQGIFGGHLAKTEEPLSSLYSPTAQGSYARSMGQAATDFPLAQELISDVVARGLRQEQQQFDDAMGRVTHTTEFAPPIQGEAVPLAHKPYARLTTPDVNEDALTRGQILDQALRNPNNDPSQPNRLFSVQPQGEETEIAQILNEGRTALHREEAGQRLDEMKARIASGEQPIGERMSLDALPEGTDPHAYKALLGQLPENAYVLDESFFNSLIPGDKSMIEVDEFGNAKRAAIREPSIKAALNRGWMTPSASGEQPKAPGVYEYLKQQGTGYRMQPKQKARGKFSLSPLEEVLGGLKNPYEKLPAYNLETGEVVDDMAISRLDDILGRTVILTPEGEVRSIIPDASSANLDVSLEKDYAPFKITTNMGGLSQEQSDAINKILEAQYVPPVEKAVVQKILTPREVAINEMIGMSALGESNFDQAIQKEIDAQTLDTPSTIERRLNDQVEARIQQIANAPADSVLGQMRDWQVPAVERPAIGADRNVIKQRPPLRDMPWDYQANKYKENIAKAERQAAELSVRRDLETNYQPRSVSGGTWVDQDRTPIVVSEGMRGAMPNVASIQNAQTIGGLDAALQQVLSNQLQDLDSGTDIWNRGNIVNHPVNPKRWEGVDEASDLWSQVSAAQQPPVTLAVETSRPATTVDDLMDAVYGDIVSEGSPRTMPQAVSELEVPVTQVRETPRGGILDNVRKAIASNPDINWNKVAKRGGIAGLAALLGGAALSNMNQQRPQKGTEMEIRPEDWGSYY